MAEVNMELKPNSHRYKEQQAEEKKEITKVTKGNVKSKKEPLSRKLSQTFLNDDTKDVKGYIFFEVLVPAIKDTIVDMITNGANMLFYGETRGRASRSGSSGTSKINYGSYYKEPSRSKRPSNAANRYSYNEVIFDTRGDAQEVIDCMCEILERYRMVTVADFYELAGVESVYTDQKYGWDDLSNATIMRDRDGYILKLPKATPID